MHYLFIGCQDRFYVAGFPIACAYCMNFYCLACKVLCDGVKIVIYFERCLVFGHHIGSKTRPLKYKKTMKNNKFPGFDYEAIELNVGMKIGATDKENTFSEVKLALWARSIATLDAKIIESESEPTFVCRALLPLGCEVTSLAQLCVALNQDCVAVYSPLNDDGSLVGPKAGNWGKFDAKYFIRFDA
jgi:hypothetical protein